VFFPRNQKLPTNALPAVVWGNAKMVKGRDFVPTVMKVEKPEGVVKNFTVGDRFYQNSPIHKAYFLPMGIGKHLNLK
jgi:hypothetical protein